MGSSLLSLSLKAGKMVAPQPPHRLTHTPCRKFSEVVFQQEGPDFCPHHSQILPSSGGKAQTWGLETLAWVLSLLFPCRVTLGKSLLLSGSYWQSPTASRDHSYVCWLDFSPTHTSECSPLN